MGPTLVSYLCGAGARVVGTVVATTAAAEAGMAGALWLAATAVTCGCAAAAATTISGPGLDPPAGGGEEWRTRGLKLCPPCLNHA